MTSNMFNVIPDCTKLVIEDAIKFYNYVKIYCSTENDHRHTYKLCLIFSSAGEGAVKR